MTLTVQFAAKSPSERIRQMVDLQCKRWELQQAAQKIGGDTVTIRYGKPKDRGAKPAEKTNSQ